MTNHSAVSLSEAVVSLYVADAVGEPDLTQPVWLGGCVEGGRIESTISTRQRHPTGAPHSKPVQGPEAHTLEFQRVWVTSRTGQNWHPARGRYVMDLTWRETNTRDWFRDRFYNVALPSGNWSAQGLYQFGVSQVFTASRRLPLAGNGLLPSENPFLDAWWLDGSEVFPLYRHDPLAHTWTEHVAGRAESRVVIASDGASIGVEGGPLWLTAGAGGLSIRGTGLPGVRALPFPRLEFRRGDTYLGALAWNGLYFPTSATVAGPITPPADAFACIPPACAGASSAPPTAARRSVSQPLPDVMHGNETPEVAGTLPPGTIGRGGKLGTQRSFIAALNATLRRKNLLRARHCGMVTVMFAEMKARRRIRAAILAAS